MKIAKCIALFLLIAIMIGISLVGIANADFSRTTYAENLPIRTKKQELVHETADLLRSYGYSDDSQAIKALKEVWTKEQNNLNIVARVIEGEGGGCDFEFKVCVGAVLRNRVEHSEYFPDTYYEAVAQPGQYTTLYLRGFDKISRESYEAAKYVLDGEDDVPHDVIWQANFPQGNEIWKIIEVDTGWFKSTNYFCKGVYGE